MNKKHKPINIGDKFECWTVTELDRKDKVKGKYWKCKCVCEDYYIVHDSELKRGKSKRCRNCLYKNICGKSNELNLLNMRFGQWEVLEKAGIHKSGQRMWKCQCSCGKISYVCGYNLKSGKSTKCGKCNQFGEITGNYWSCLQKCARSRNLELSITIEEANDLFVKQNRKCAITGVDIYFAKNSKTKNKGNASLDRIHSSKGYAIDNVQWVHKIINVMKWSMENNEFYTICKLVYEKNKDNIEETNIDGLLNENFVKIKRNSNTTYKI